MSEIEGTVTRQYLANVIYNKLGCSRAEASELIDAVLNEMNVVLKEEGSLKLSSFGTFKVREKKARVGRNPKTKEEAVISPRKVVSFYVSNLLKKRINS